MTIINAWTANLNDEEFQHRYRNHFFKGKKEFLGIKYIQNEESIKWT